ncbi:unnamed protein product [Amoebophrya sp. A25]|nr:unnamed protein product [Amoebophrya sp. A25]|eukprot:GSA25T00001961001.1
MGCLESKDAYAHPFDCADFGSGSTAVKNDAGRDRVELKVVEYSTSADESTDVGASSSSNCSPLEPESSSSSENVSAVKKESAAGPECEIPTMVGVPPSSSSSLSSSVTDTTFSNAGEGGKKKSGHKNNKSGKSKGNKKGKGKGKGGNIDGKGKGKK